MAPHSQIGLCPSLLCSCNQKEGSSLPCWVQPEWQSVCEHRIQPGSSSFCVPSHPIHPPSWSCTQPDAWSDARNKEFKLARRCRPALFRPQLLPDSHFSCLQSKWIYLNSKCLDSTRTLWLLITDVDFKTQNENKRRGYDSRVEELSWDGGIWFPGKKHPSLWRVHEPRPQRHMERNEKNWAHVLASYLKQDSKANMSWRLGIQTPVSCLLYSY